MNAHLTSRRAIEALRAGVPNRDAVLALGCEQSEVEERFREQLQAAKEGATNGTQATGLLIAGDFGSGKSHLLEYLHQTALAEHFMSSKVVISKETPLYDPIKLYRAAIRAAVVPGKRGVALTEVTAHLDPTSQAFNELSAWTHTADLNSRFAATLFLFKRLGMDMELRNRLVSFWSGDPLDAGEIRKQLKACGERATYKIDKISARDLALQRFQFIPQLLIAAGYAGWVMLVDEVELIGRYSWLQRAKSYADLLRWIGKLPGEAIPGLLTVFAIMSNFESYVLEEKHDLETIPNKLREKGLEDLAKHVERGMRLIPRDRLRLKAPAAEMIQQTCEKVRKIHAEAYDWHSPPLRVERQGITSMREYVKRWITEWDLKRLDPNYTVELEKTPLEQNYSEETALETSSDEGSVKGTE
ncbi:MAG: BREX system ATP-binding domain-containing protein [Candidatus Binatia bacterium]